MPHTTDTSRAAAQFLGLARAPTAEAPTFHPPYPHAEQADDNAAWLRETAANARALELHHAEHPLPAPEPVSLRDRIVAEATRQLRTSDALETALETLVAAKRGAASDAEMAQARDILLSAILDLRQSAKRVSGLAADVAAAKAVV